MTKCLEVGEAVLRDGGTALDAATQAVCALEDEPLFNAGRGAVFNANGEHEMDAAVMGEVPEVFVPCKHKPRAVWCVTINPKVDNVVRPGNDNLGLFILVPTLKRIEEGLDVSLVKFEAIRQNAVKRFTISQNNAEACLTGPSSVFLKAHAVTEAVNVAEGETGLTVVSDSRREDSVTSGEVYPTIVRFHAVPGQVRGICL